MRKQRPVKPSLSANVDPLRITAGKAERKKEAHRRSGFTRGGYLEWLYNNRKIRQAQYLAGCRVRALFAERQGQARGIDLTAERVDGGRRPCDRQSVGAADAERLLKSLGNRLGADQAFVLFHVIGAGFSLNDVATHFMEPEKLKKTGLADKPSRDYCGRLLKDALHHAAFFLGYATRAADCPVHRRVQLCRE
ncbi:MAG: hypothetical protein ABJJ37_27115 [Roseibium sp.]